MPSLPPTYSTNNLTVEFTLEFLRTLDDDGISLVLRPCELSGEDGYVLEQVGDRRLTFQMWVDTLRTVARETLPPELTYLLFHRLVEALSQFEGQVDLEASQEVPRATVRRLVQYSIPESEPPGDLPPSRYERDPVI